ncbi:MAG: IS110 family transposase [Chloroflexi bacterium]|nr:MAG: IS110 family transposase [Chloroflexota bacterium]
MNWELRWINFLGVAHLVSWVGLCPDAKISAGKRLSSKTGKGNRWLRQIRLSISIYCHELLRPTSRPGIRERSNLLNWSAGL